MLILMHGNVFNAERLTYLSDGLKLVEYRSICYVCELLAPCCRTITVLIAGQLFVTLSLCKPVFVRRVGFQSHDSWVECKPGFNKDNCHIFS